MCVRSICWNILIHRVHLINSIINILLTKSSDRWRLNITFVQLKWECIGRYNWTIISWEAIIICLWKLRTILTFLFLLILQIVESLPHIVNLFNSDWYSSSMILRVINRYLSFIIMIVGFGIKINRCESLNSFNEPLQLVLIVISNLLRLALGRICRSIRGIDLLLPGIFSSLCSWIGLKLKWAHLHVLLMGSGWLLKHVTASHLDIGCNSLAIGLTGDMNLLIFVIAHLFSSELKLYTISNKYD